MAIILGIDPGSRFAGFAVINHSDSQSTYIESGTICVSKELSFSSKLLYLSQEIGKVFARNNISQVSIEKAFFGKNADSAFKIGHVRGVCLLSAARHDCEVFEYAAKYAKKVVTGSGASGKDSVQAFVNQFLNLQITSFDESDALALALCHASAISIKSKLDKSLKLRI